MSKPITDLMELREDFRDKVKELLKNLMPTPNYGYVVTETYRSQSRQDGLYAQGRSDPGKIVTWTTHSKHTDRIAVDIAVTFKGQVTYDTDNHEVAMLYNQIGVEAKKLGLEWGGNWKSKDMCHIEMVK